MILLSSGERHGQSQIITCSGAYNNGSLRIIRSGIGINEEAVVEVSGLKESWAIKASDDDIFDKYLVQSYIGESRILVMENEEMGEVTCPIIQFCCSPHLMTIISFILFLHPDISLLYF